MGESACLRRSLSQPSGGLRETKEGDPLRRLRESVSFGRFMTEQLDWERWSAFSHNRYLEEAERFSKPGSVAQKKAYFEAHFKKKAAERAVTLLEASSVAVAPTNVAEPPVAEDKACKDPGSDKEECFVDEQEQLGKHVANIALVCSSNENLSFERDESDASKLENLEEEEEEEEEEEVVIQASDDVESSNLSGNSEDRNKIGFATEDILISSEDASSLEVAASTKQKGKAKASPKMSSPKFLLSSAKRTAHSQTKDVNNLGSRSKSFVKDSVDKRNAKSLHMSIHFTSGINERRKISSPIMQKIRSLKNLTTSLNVSKNSSASPQTKPKASVNGPSKIPSLNLKSEEKRSYSTRPMLNKSIAGVITSDRKLKSLSADNSESSDGKGTKPRSSIVSSPFSFRSEERAAKRKEFYQRLEERKNADEARKKNPQTKYQPRSPALGRKPLPNKTPDANARPSENSESKSLENDRRTNHSVTSRSQKNARENASPNIQKSASKI